MVIDRIKCTNTIRMLTNEMKMLNYGFWNPAPIARPPTGAAVCAIERREARVIRTPAHIYSKQSKIRTSNVAVNRAAGL